MTTADFKPRRLGIAYPSPTSAEWRRILRKCKHANTGHSSPCWIFTGRIDSDGYGEVKFRGSKRFAHRIALAWKVGCAPARRDTEHLCKQRACCNPAHIVALPPKENAGGRSDGGEAPIQVNKSNIEDYVLLRGQEVPF